MLLRGAKVVTVNGSFELDVRVDGERIGAIAPAGTIRARGEVVDLAGRWLLPGGIDPHVHFREPGAHEPKGTYASESRAAAAGGVTTVLTMPNTVPHTRDWEVLKLVRRRALRSLVDHGFWLYADAGNLDFCRRARAVGLKLYLNETTGVSSPLCDEALVARILSLGRTVAAHAEGETLDWLLDLHAHWGTGPLYIVHVALAREVDSLRAAKARGQWVFGEATPHHLFLTDADAARLGPFGDMRPTLKTAADQQAVWSGIADGTIDCVGTDHAPHLREEKLAEPPPPGVPGLQTMFPLLLDATHDGRLSPERLVALTSRNAADIFRLRGKGAIRVGADADLVVVDPLAEHTITDVDQLTKPGWTPFAGRRVRGRVEATLRRGQWVYRDGRVADGAGGREVSVG